MEIDWEMQNSLSARDAAQKEIQRIRDSTEMDIVRLRQQNSNLSVQNGDLTVQLSRLEGQIEEITKQRDKIFAELSDALSRTNALKGDGKKSKKNNRLKPHLLWCYSNGTPVRYKPPLVKTLTDDDFEKGDAGLFFHNACSARPCRSGPGT